MTFVSYARQGIDKIPTVHMGPAVSQLEKKGIQTNIGNLNRDIKAANSLMQSIRQMVRSLKGWLSGLKEKKAALLEALEQAKEPTIPELLSRYLDMRSEERTGWTSKGKLKGTVGDFNKVMEALDFLRQKRSPPWRALTPIWIRSAGRYFPPRLTSEIGTPDKGHRHHPFPYRQPRNLQRGLQEIRFHRLENPEGEVCRRTPGRTGRLPCRQAFFQSPSGGTAL